LGGTSEAGLVEPSTVVETPRRIELRIGESKQSKSRYAALTPREAQKIAIALLMQAEASLEGKTQTH
jgi:hypothetical protein